MKEYVINSFKFGIDTRRDLLTSQPGTMVSCENANINPGGEIEKRKSFSVFSDVSGTFGLETTSAGLVVFGSALPFGSGVTQGQPVLGAAPTGGVIYQQLKHPTLYNDTAENYVSGRHAMTAIVFSENFNGKAFAAAKFADGNTFLYYDGALVQQSANGLVLAGREDADDLSDDLLRQIKVIGWDGMANRNRIVVTSLNVTGAGSGVAILTSKAHGLTTGALVEVEGATPAGYNGIFIIRSVTTDDFRYTVPTSIVAAATGTIYATVKQDGSTLIKSPPANYFTPVPSDSSTAGVLATLQLMVDGPSTPALSAVAAFNITGNGDFTLSAPTASDGTGSIDLCGGTVIARGSSADTALAIVSAINDLTFVHGYTAIVNGAKVYVYANTDWNNFSGLLTVNTTGTATIETGSTPSTINLVFDPEAPTLVSTLHVGDSFTALSGTLRCIPSGGTPPYTFKWSYADIDSSQLGTIVIAGIGGIGDNGATIRFVAQSGGVIPTHPLVSYVYSRNYVCQVQDSASNIIAGHVTVSLIVNVTPRSG